MIISPYSDPKLYEAGGPLYPSATNFPGALCFLPCKQEEIGRSYLTDAINGITFTKASGTIETPATPDGYSVFPNAAAASGNEQSGSGVTGTGTDPFLYFVVGKNTGATYAGGFGIGDTASGPGLASSSAGTSAIKVGSNPYPATAFSGTTQNTIYGRALFMSNANNASGLTSMWATVSGTSVTSGAATTTADTTPSTPASLNLTTLHPNDGQTEWNCAGSGANTTTNLYGVLLYKFTTAPAAAEVQAAIAWMTYQWSIGNKWIYPGFKGRS